MPSSPSATPIRRRERRPRKMCSRRLARQAKQAANSFAVFDDDRVSRGAALPYAAARPAQVSRQTARTRRITRGAPGLR
ncbi:hypothetical protein C7S16_0652 [Burkholderia thailandensis]|uniref:Uncharacterized protein n=1 Tax=Burkholderia thailandensis TaxID=57975 RepID=A0AAW9D0E6_BURTH|nr:hypothetical protein [Burkholderia thailandensis]MDW9254374.1 hypothetical protein [Burkholderia thailandensis]